MSSFFDQAEACRKKIKVPLPEGFFTEDLYMHELSCGEVQQFHRDHQAVLAETDDTDDLLGADAIEAGSHLVVKAARKPSGDRMFSDDDVERVKNLPTQLLMILIQSAMQAISVEDLDEVKKN